MRSMSVVLVLWVIVTGAGCGLWRGARDPRWAVWPETLSAEKTLMGDQVDALHAQGGDSSPLDVRLIHHALADFRRRYGYRPDNEGCEGVPSALGVSLARLGDRYLVAVGFDSGVCPSSILFEVTPTWEFDANGKQLNP